MLLLACHTTGSHSPEHRSCQRDTDVFFQGGNKTISMLLNICVTPVTALKDEPEHPDWNDRHSTELS